MGTLIHRCRTIAVVLFTVLVIAGVGYGVWWAFASALSWVMAQGSQVAGAVIAFAGTVIAGIGAVVISQQRSKSREIAESHRPKKVELYSKFITTMVDILRTHNGGESVSIEASKELEDFFFNFTSQVVLWGSPGVLRHYATFRHIGQERNPNVLLIVDDMMQAMRKDLGLSNWGLARGDLMKMFLTDPESLDKLLAN